MTKKIIFLSLLLSLVTCKPKDRPFGFTPIYIGKSSLSHFEDPNTLVSVFPAGIFGNQKSGYNFGAKLEPSVSRSISYEVMFSPDFDFVRGGKLPGLCSGNHVSGGKKATGKNGFSVRAVWKKEGDAFVYIYHVNQKENFGDIFPLVDLSQNKIQFKRNEWQKMMINVRTNDITKENGSVRVWLNDMPVFEKNDFVFRTIEDVKIDLLCFNTFFGGDDSSWAPKKREKLSIKNLKITE